MYADYCINYTILREHGENAISLMIIMTDFVFSCNSSCGGEDEQDTEEIDEEIGQQ